MTSRPRAAAAAFGVLLLSLAGCADDGLPKRYPVTGKVTYKGKPMDEGTINFIPESDTGRGASGTIRGGTYTLTTHAPDDGALPGKYKVTVTAYESDLTGVHKEASKAAGGGSAMPDQVAVAKAQGKSAVPEKYASINTTPLQATVEEKSNALDFTLE